MTITFQKASEILFLIHQTHEIDSMPDFLDSLPLAIFSLNHIIHQHPSMYAPGTEPPTTDTPQPGQAAVVDGVITTE
jgi:hypothetical protein